MRRIIAAFLLVFPLLAGLPMAASAMHEGTFVAEPQELNSIAVDGDFVYWIDRGGIWGANIDDREPFEVFVGPGDRSDLGADNGVLVWSESQTPGCVGCSRDVWGLRIQDRERFAISATDDDETGVLISGDWVVWSHMDADGVTLKARNIATMDEAIVLPVSKPRLGKYALDGTRVVLEYYFEPSRPLWELWTFEIGDATATLVDAGSSLNGSLFGLDLAGDTVVYIGEGFIVTRHNVTTGATQTFQASPYDQSLVSDGRYAIWTDHTRPAFVDEYARDLRAFDFDTGSAFMIAVGDGEFVASEFKDGVLAWASTGPFPFENHQVHVARFTDLLPSARQSDAQANDPNLTYYPETGHYLGFGFRTFWQHNGGLPVFGFPLTEEFNELNPDTGDRYTVQYVERQRFEYHPENAGTLYEVLLGRLGAQLLEAQDRNWQEFPKADPTTASYFVETGQAIAPQFATYWNSHGLDLGDAGVSYRESLALFGFPISPAMTETNADGHTVLTQYFERAVFEYHPDNPAEYQVLLRRLGAEVLAERGW